MIPSSSHPCAALAGAAFHRTPPPRAPREDLRPPNHPSSHGNQAPISTAIVAIARAKAFLSAFRSMLSRTLPRPVCYRTLAWQVLASLQQLSQPSLPIGWRRFFRSVPQTNESIPILLLFFYFFFTSFFPLSLSLVPTLSLKTPDLLGLRFFERLCPVSGATCQR